ncbi:MAG TPA: P1 family peptidase [Acidimicrobiales bacterium]
MALLPGPRNDISDVTGVAVGHYQRIGRGWLTGTTVVLCPPGTTGGVDVRGGGPGTRETDLLRPENLVHHVDAVCLTGGSAYGLAAAGGVMSWLEAKGRGFPVGTEPDAVVPIVPAAVLFDLGRGGVFANRPDAEFGRRAAAAARTRPGTYGSVGAGAGAMAAGLKGGVGSASVRLESGITVAALVAVNAAGSVLDGGTGLPHAAHLLMPGDPRLRRPPAAERRALVDHLAAIGRPLNTTIGVVATDACLDKAECTKLAAVGHDGLARAIRPAHSMFDGDTLFALATGALNLPVDEADLPFRSLRGRAATLNTILAAGADCVARAVVRAVVEATSVPGIAAYRDICSSAMWR